MLKLYYVRGINETDTPHFNTLVEQEEYFEEKLITTIDAFFPPHYTDRLQFSNDDLDFNSQINYMSLDFNGKTYYYFITDMDYIAEDLISISITMDTIQTFMFNMIFHNARIERETIKRWLPNGDINRNYIRENYSSNIYELQEYTNLQDTAGLAPNQYGQLGFLVVKQLGTSESVDIFNSRVSIQKQYNPDESVYPQPLSLLVDGSRVLIAPVFTLITQDNRLNNMDIEIYNNDELLLSQPMDLYINAFYNEVVTDTKSYELYYMRNLNLEGLNVGIVYNTDTNKFILKVAMSSVIDGAIPFQILPDTGIINIRNAKLIDDYKIIDLGSFIKVDEYIPFNYYLVPQLIDENYIKFSYGERINNTTYPLSKLPNNRLYLHSYNDVFTGFRNYWITDTTTYDDVYFTTITVDTKEYSMLITDSWKNYLANNIGSLTLGTTLKTISAISTFTLPTSSSITNKVIKKKNKATKNRMKIVGKQRTIKENYSNPTSDVTDLLDTGTEMLNNYFAPDSVKQGGHYTSDYMTGALDVIYKYEYASNIESVATIYESIGYKVDRYVGSENPLKQNRKIFNYIECSEIDLEINMLCSQDITNDINNRYIQGLRFWNIDTMNNLGLNLGDVCVYDNLDEEEE